jgi:hypothetical protein
MSLAKKHQNRRPSTRREIAELQQESEKLKTQQAEQESPSTYGE